MNKPKLFRVLFPPLLLAMLMVACAEQAEAPSPTPADTAPPPATEATPPTPTLATSATELSEKGTWETFEFTSDALADNLLDDPATRTIHVYLPPGYDVSNERYPVVYGLHGYLEDPTWLRGMGPQLDALIADGQAGGIILILPDGDNSLGGGWYQNSPTIGDYESYIASELVAYVDDNYRTLADRDARGIAGCSMGGNGALHLALKYPEVFGTAASVSGGYAYENYPQWEDVRTRYTEPVHPSDLSDIVRLPWDFRVIFALAAAAAPNPDNPPFYFDLPFEIVGAEAQIVPEVLQKVSDINVIHDVEVYVDQPIRLRGIAVYHGISDDVPVEMARDFSAFLTELGVEHQYTEVDAAHCGRAWDYTDLLRFMAENLRQ
jgi:pimeloyl-ACP methyl ester carboxylesterase